jgi:putative ABC transport system ATP-binding protein
MNIMTSNARFAVDVTPCTPLMTLTGVDKSFGDGDVTVHALRNVDLTIMPGMFCALTGPSGSGKSTLLNIVGLLDTPSSGTIALEGIGVDAGDEARRLQIRRGCFGFVFQSYNLVPTLSALENVELALFHDPAGRRERTARASHALDMVGLADRMGHRPKQMSGGQQQRVAVARALVRAPKLVLADEPTANLDAGNAVKLMELMLELRERTGTAFLVSTHDHRLLSRFVSVVCMEDGRILS